MEYYSAIKGMKYLLMHATTWKNLEKIKLSEKSDIKGHILYDSICIKFQNRQTYRDKNRA